MWNKKRDKGGLRLLVAEDDPHDQLLFAMAAQDLDGDIDVTFANDGAELLEKLRRSISQSEIPDFVVLDLRMPRLDGHATLERIRADATLSIVEVVIFSSSAHPDDVSRSLAGGALRHEVKPSTYQELTEFIARLDQFCENPSKASSPVS